MRLEDQVVKDLIVATTTLRYVKRNGMLILQQMWKHYVGDPTERVTEEWRDVPIQNPIIGEKQ